MKLDKHVREKNPDLSPMVHIKADNYDDGEDLARIVSKVINMPPEMFKLVSAGSVIKNDQRLNAQKIKPGQTVMVLTVDHNSEAVMLVNEQRRILSEAKEDAEILGDKDEMTIADQNGRQVELPKEERKAIIIAMSLHEKGKSAMKRGNFALAIVLLLEAKDEYNTCRSEILKAVDNYGLLNLDIAWCYLRVGNLSELPNAQDRLRECEANFKKSYGDNLQRVIALKGTSSSEAVLLLRLHLLQSISSFISGFKNEAKILMEKAMIEYKILNVPPEALEEVVAQGFTEREARLALRAKKHAVPDAVRYIIDSRKRKEELEKEESERRKKRAKLGKTVDGSWVNLGYMSTLVKMGYPEELAGKALRHTNNEMNQAIDVMNDNPELLLEEYLDEDEKKITKEMIETVANMGFDRDVAQAALRKFKGDVGKTIDLLTKNPDKILDLMMKEEENDKKVEEARKRMEEDLADEEDHLDLTLEEEGAYLEQYQKLLKLI